MHGTQSELTYSTRVHRTPGPKYYKLSDFSTGLLSSFVLLLRQAKKVVYGARAGESGKLRESITERM